MLGTAAVQRLAVLEDFVLLSLQLEAGSYRARQGRLHTVNFSFHLFVSVK